MTKKKNKVTYSINETSKCNEINEPSIELYGPPYTFDKVWQMFKETDKMFKETDKMFKETDKKLNKLENLFTGQWGKLIESLVSGDLINLLAQRGIQVQRLNERSRFRYNNTEGEFDIIAVNGNEVVIVEVKTTLRTEDVKHFLENLKLFREIFHEYKDKKVYGAIAYLKAESRSDLYSQRHGLFAIRATGNSASIVNSDDFKPAEF
jgi:Holliday junction resolvase-like predicted endonuclease